MAERRDREDRDDRPQRKDQRDTDSDAAEEPAVDAWDRVATVEGAQDVAPRMSLCDIPRMVGCVRPRTAQDEPVTVTAHSAGEHDHLDRADPGASRWGRAQAAALLTVLAAVQLAWLAALCYGLVRLLG